LSRHQVEQSLYQRSGAGTYFALLSAEAYDGFALAILINDHRSRQTRPRNDLGVCMSLQEYRRKRHFKRTAEPAGKVGKMQGSLFVVQKHRARQLHYDFRLELEGVLKSWAVPKGPCLDPEVKRLAVQVEDHPVEYGDFEGIIPRGEYGGGTVMLWDRGTWEPLGNPLDGFSDGRIKFSLHGEKLRGRWMLVRTGNQRDGRRRPQWLLFKERDEEARPIKNLDVLVSLPTSVKTGRSLDEIAADGDKVWYSKKPGHKHVAPAAAKSSLSAVQKRQLKDVRLTHPDKVLYPDEGITKLELAYYYLTVEKWILPHIEDRPLVLVRCPEGMHNECFYQKHPRVGSPKQLKQVMIRESDKAEPFAVVNDLAGLVSLAQIAAMEIHAWGARTDKIEQPDRLIFDLDPDPDLPWRRVVQSARQVRQFLEELGLESFVKTTGGKGLHLVVPIARRHDWDEVRDFCKQVADLIVKADPAHYTANMSKAARPGKIYIDYLRNARGATAIVPYSTRARSGATVSVPLSWSELSAEVHSNYYTIRNLPGRLATLKKDPWAEITKVRQSLAPALKTLRTLSRQ
jgi:bifunctional non-homologous end joining protein LigD